MMAFLRRAAIFFFKVLAIAFALGLIGLAILDLYGG